MEIGEKEIKKIQYRGVTYVIKITRFTLLYEVVVASARTKQKAMLTTSEKLLKDCQIKLIKILCHR